MGAAFKDLRSLWIAQARAWDVAGRFAKYPPKQREEILRKGYLGTWPPDEVIRLASREVELGHAFRKAKFNDEIRDHFGLVGDEVRDALLAILDEVPPESYIPPKELEDPPGCPFVFHCNYLRSDIYLKIQVAGDNKRPRVLLWSCHPPVY